MRLKLTILFALIAIAFSFNLDRESSVARTYADCSINNGYDITLEDSSISANLFGRRANSTNILSLQSITKRVNVRREVIKALLSLNLINTTALFEYSYNCKSNISSNYSSNGDIILILRNIRV